MAWTTMHFAMGMGCAGLAAGAVCLVLRRGWRWLPVAMTAGGVWGFVPDLPRIFREDLPHLPLGATLGSRSLENWLHEWGNVFFFHASLDQQPRELALHGLILILLMYNGAIGLLMYLERRARCDPAARAAALHRAARHQLGGTGDHAGRRHRRRHHHGQAIAAHGHHEQERATSRSIPRLTGDTGPIEALPVQEFESPVLERIGPQAPGRGMRDRFPHAGA